MFAGLYVPRKRNNFSRFACLIDQSGSMSNDDIAFGLSQLQAIDDRAEGTLVPADSEIYWKKAIKIKNCKSEELLKLKRVAGGGTMFASFFTDYKKELNEDQNFLIVITDAYLLDSDLVEMRDPGIDVFWIVTSGHESFKPPFGKVYCLKP
jgi:predicted metal-dependent peptidase